MTIFKFLFAAILLVASAGVVRCDPPICDMETTQYADSRGCPSDPE